MKATLIHNCWIASHNGGNTVMRSLLDNSDVFESNGIELHQFTLDTIYPRSFDPSDKSSSGTASRIRAKVRLLLNWLSAKSAFFTWFNYNIDAFRSSKLVISKYLETNPDSSEVAFFHSVLPCYFYLKMRKTKQKTVLVMHTNGDAFQMDRIYYPKLEKSKYYKRLMDMYNYTIHHVDRINFVAEEPRDNFIRLNPSISPDKVYYIHNGISTKPVINRNSLNSPLRICCVGSISDRKGQQFIIDALKRLSPEMVKKLKFTFIGDGTMKRKLEAEAKENGLINAVSFVGVSSNVDEYLENSDIFILPSKDEGLPMAILEAMRSSLPIISTPVGGIPEMLKDGYNGVMVEPCSNAIKRLLENITQYDWLKMGINSRALFDEKFSVNKMVEQYAKLLTF